MLKCARSFGTSARENFLQSLSNPPKTHPRFSKIPSSMAVFIPLFEEEGAGRLVLTKRSTLLRSHRGEVCFPGGKQDKGESLEQTALRETHEEIGLPYQDLEIWGHLQPVVTRQLSSTVTPVVGFVKDTRSLEHLSVNSDEVHIVFSVPIDELCENVRYTQFKSKKFKYLLPVFQSSKYEILYKHPGIPFHGDLRIWGLSALMMHQLLEAINPHYVPELKVAFF